MTKKQIQKEISCLGFNSSYSGKTKTFYVDTRQKIFNPALFVNINKLGFKIEKI